MRGKKRAKKWYAREAKWPGKVHRSKKVMARATALLAAKRKREAKLNTPEARAARKRAMDGHIQRVKKLRTQRASLVETFLKELAEHAAA